MKIPRKDYLASGIKVQGLRYGSKDCVAAGVENSHVNSQKRRWVKAETKLVCEQEKTRALQQAVRGMVNGWKKRCTKRLRTHHC